MSEPKRIRTYEGEALERRRAYQRAYNQKKRDAEKAQGKKPYQRQPHQAPMASTPQKPDNYLETIVKQHTPDEIRKMIEADKLKAGNDFNDSSIEFFNQFKKN